jgi:hypothetical protein
MSTGTVLNLNHDDYDASGNIEHVTNSLDATRNKTFTYDLLDRLDTANGAWGALDWDYDGVGNRTTETTGGTISVGNIIALKK